MENREELLMEILKRVQRNYRHMVEIERVTKEMADALSRNDQESVIDEDAAGRIGTFPGFEAGDSDADRSRR